METPESKRMTSKQLYDEKVQVTSSCSTQSEAETCREGSMVCRNLEELPPWGIQIVISSPSSLLLATPQRPPLSQHQSSRKHLWPLREMQGAQQQQIGPWRSFQKAMSRYTEDHSLLCSRLTRGWLSRTASSPNCLAGHPRSFPGQ